MMKKELQTMEQFLKDFKDFAMKGKVLDLAVGVIVGAAFGKIITSLVEDVISPVLGVITGGIDFRSLFWNLSSTKVESVAKAKELGLPVIAYGDFIQSILDFVMQAFVLFVILRIIMSFRREETPETPARVCPYCKMEIAEDATRCPHCTSEL